MATGDGPAVSDPDAALLARLVTRDEAALAELYDRHGRAAHALALRVTGNAETAQDVVQEAFLALWRRGHTYQPERGAVRGWLLTVVRNRAIDALRGSGGQVARVLPVDTLVLAATDNPEAEAMQAVDGRRVRAALAALPPEQRDVVELAYFGGLAYPEVAERMGIPLGTVKSRMRLALERLRGSLRAWERDA